jgi:hypothetical protein
MSYTLVDWAIDAFDRGQCFVCKGFALERMGADEAQCYSCGRWFSVFALGYSDAELMHLSTAYQKEERRRQAQGIESYESMKFVERMSYVPEVNEDLDHFLE